MAQQNLILSSTFQPPEEGRSVQRPKRCDKHGYNLYPPLEKDRENEQVWVPKTFSEE